MRCAFVGSLLVVVVALVDVDVPFGDGCLHSYRSSYLPDDLPRFFVECSRYVSSFPKAIEKPLLFQVSGKSARVVCKVWPYARFWMTEVRTDFLGGEIFEPMV